MENLKQKFVCSNNINLYTDNLFFLQSFIEKNHFRHSIKYTLQFYLNIALQ